MVQSTIFFYFSYFPFFLFAPGDINQAVCSSYIKPLHQKNAYTLDDTDENVSQLGTIDPGIYSVQKCQSPGF